MPVIRSAKGKREDDPLQAAAASSGASSEPLTFSFVPNVTPVTFSASPSTDEDEIPSQSTLFPDPVSPSEPTLQEAQTPPPAKRRRRGIAKDGVRDDGRNAHIPRPPNAFILFRSSFIKSQHVSSTIEGNHGTLSKIVGMLWHNLSYEERQIWQAKARRAYAEHKRMYPQYSFKPTNKDKDKPKASTDSSSSITPPRRDDSVPPPKRKHRECGPRDVARCEQIAAFLAKGLKGRELEEAMNKFDATRKPVAITPRFEMPLTAQQYEDGSMHSPTVKEEPKEEKVEETRATFRQLRRSSSAPLLDTEHMENVRRQSLSISCPTLYSTLESKSQSISPTHILASAPTIRSQRRRSASSSPPCRVRPLLPATSHLAALSCHSAQPQLTLSTSMTEAQVHSYATSAPLSAPVVSRQPTLGLEQSGSDMYFDIDSSQTALLFDDAQSSSPSTSNIGEYNFEDDRIWLNSGFDFGSFSFTSSGPEALPPATPQTYSPFEQPNSTTQSTCSSQDEYSGMPILVERPVQYPLSVQTNWSATDFNYNPSFDSAYPPSSAGPLSSASPCKSYGEDAHVFTHEKVHGLSSSFGLSPYTPSMSPTSTRASDGALTRIPGDDICEGNDSIYSSETRYVHNPKDIGSYLSQAESHPACFNVNVSINLENIEGVDFGMMGPYLPQHGKGTPLGNEAEFSGFTPILMQSHQHAY